jgi:hypothetical protein
MRAPALSLQGVERIRRAARLTAGLSGAALVAFHGWLLTGQFVSGRLTDPGVALRWLMAGALVAGLAALYRSGESIWSRKGVAIWVLAALLHGPAVAAAATDDAGVLSLPEAVATVVIQITATAGALALGLWILCWLAGVTERPATLRPAGYVVGTPRRLRPHRRPFSPRPPPRA